MELLAIYREFAQAAGPAAVTALWQGALLALGPAVCMRLAPHASAADRFRAWAAGFAALVALPFLPLLGAIHFGTGGGNAHATGLAPAQAWLDLDLRWALAIAGTWIAASLWRTIDLAVHGVLLYRVWKRAAPIECNIAGLDAEVCTTHELDRPSVIGFFRPRILIPGWLAGRLTAAELEQVILHEAEHLRRHDDWTNLLQKLALAVFPLNPALAWMERQLCHEREMACDDAVVRTTGKPRAYAACLASLAERGLERRREALNLGAWRRRPELAGRVHRLLKRGKGFSPAAARVLLAAVGCGVAFGSVELARAPQLVAFVTPPVVAQSNTPDLVNAGLRAPAGYMAINAVAHVPSRAEMTSEPGFNAAEQKRSSAVAATETRGVEHAQMTSDNASGARSTEAPGFVETAATQNADGEKDTGQWIVLATWEQVVMVQRNAGTVADYDVNQAATDNAELTGTSTAAGSSTAPAVVRQWTVTHLILRIDPAKAAGGGGAAQNGSKPDSRSQPAQPAAIPPRDGWLVFQL